MVFSVLDHAFLALVKHRFDMNFTEHGESKFDYCFGNFVYVAEG